MKNKIKIIIADDEALFRKWLKYTISSESNYEIIAETDNGIEATRIILNAHPDIAIIDYELPFINGLKVAASVLQKNQKQKILMMTVHMNNEIINEAMELGIKGFLQKDSEENELLPAIEEILNGGTFYSNKTSGK